MIRAALSTRASWQASPEPATDLDLVEAARAGSRPAFRALVERYQSLVCSVACALTGSVTESEEVAQEVFLAAWKRLGEMQQPERLRGWLVGIARNLTYRRLRDEKNDRSKASTPLASEPGVPSTEPSPLDLLISSEEERMVGRALGMIPEPYRIALVLFYREQKSVEQVAKLLDLTETNVKQRLWRGRRLLQEQLVSVVENVLERTKPTAKFTAAVMAILAAAAATNAPAEASTAEALGGRRAGAQRRPQPPGLLAGSAALVVLVGAGVFVAARDPSVAVHGSAAGARPPAPPYARVTGPSVAQARVVGAAAPIAPLEPAPRFRFDFEDGVLPSVLGQGLVVPGPARPGNQYCVVATLLLDFWKRTAVNITDPEKAVAYLSSTATVSYDYWLAPGDFENNWVSVVAWDIRTKRNYTFHDKNPVKGAWTRIHVRLADAVSEARGAPPMEEGDGFSNIGLMGGRVGGNAFFVDNIEITN